MSHNAELPTHRYVWVNPDYIYDKPKSEELVPAVWFGVSSHPGRVLGCNILLENGATIVDLPIYALRSSRTASRFGSIPKVAWDCFGWDVEVHQPRYLSGLTVEILTEEHNKSGSKGRACFAVDWINNGWSDYPEQHKWLWVIEGDDGSFWMMPQDRLLFLESSFTDRFGELDQRIKRQSIVWSAEP